MTANQIFWSYAFLTMAAIVAPPRLAAAALALATGCVVYAGILRS